MSDDLTVANLAKDLAQDRLDKFSQRSSVMKKMKILEDRVGKLTADKAELVQEILQVERELRASHQENKGLRKTFTYEGAQRERLQTELKSLNVRHGAMILRRHNPASIRGSMWR